MKKNILYISIFVFYFLNIKCAPDIDLGLHPVDYSGETKTIKVKEYKTNSPVSGAKFSTYYCKEYDIEFGQCTYENTILLSSCTTDNNGICNCIFPNMSFHHINIEKSMYWAKHYHNIESSNEYTIQPEAWVNVTFKTNATYPSTSIFYVKINGELRYETASVPVINNSNKIFILFGNEENKIDWVLHKTYDSGSEILNSGSFILHPNKFENLEYTLNY